MCVGIESGDKVDEDGEEEEEEGEEEVTNKLGEMGDQPGEDCQDTSANMDDMMDEEDEDMDMEVGQIYSFNSIYGQCHAKTDLWTYAKSVDPDQPPHLRRCV